MLQSRNSRTPKRRRSSGFSPVAALESILKRKKHRRFQQAGQVSTEALEQRTLLTAKPFATSDAIHTAGPNGSADFYAQAVDTAAPTTFVEYGIASVAFSKADFGLGASQTVTDLNSATLTLTHNDRGFTAATSTVEFFFTTDDFNGNYSALAFDTGVTNGIDNGNYTSTPVSLGQFAYTANPAGSPNADTYTLSFDTATEAALITELNNESEFSIIIAGVNPNEAITYSGVGNTFDPGDPVLDLDVNATAAAGAEISVEGNSTIIVDGDTTPHAADGTDFGAIDTATGSETRTFTIENTGSADLDVSAVNLTGANSGDFSIQNFTAGAVAPSGSLTFDVVFDPSVDGLREATVEIVNDDSDENPFDFSIQGVGTTAGVSALDSIVFNELLADPNGANNFDTDGDGSAETADEFVEIYNTSTDSLDIGGLEFWDGSGGNYFTIPLGTTLGPNGFVVVVASVAGGSLPTVDAGSHAFSPGGGMSLSNGGEDVVLYDPVNEVYIQAVYNGNTPDDPTTYSGISATATIVGSIVDLGNDIDGVSVALSPDGDTANATPHNAIGDGSILATPGASNTAPVAGPPSFAIAAADADKAESNAGSTATFSFTVTRSGDTSAANDVDYAVTGSGVNQADGSDFQGAALPSGTLNFAAGEASQTVEIIVNGDNDIEPDEGFTVTLSNATDGASISTATADGVIRNDDTAAPEFAITATDASKPEGNSGTTDFTFTVERTGNTVGMDTVEFDVTGALTDGADAADFFGGSFPSGTVTFNDSETTATITIQVAGDMDIEATEGFTVTLSNPSRSGTLSTPSADGSIIDDDAPPPIVWINEFHYDDEGTDDNEFVEVAGTAGTDLTDWSIVLYNGSNGTSYNTTTLSGVIDDEDSGIGAVSFAISGIQNGAPDAIALVNALGTLVEFISYEGVLTGVGGPADGVTSVDVGVSETNADAPGQSLQRTNSDTGGWFGPTDDSPGDLNTIPVPEFAIVAQDADKAEGSGGGTTTFTFLVTRSGDTTQANDVDYAVTGSVADGVDANDFSGGALPAGTLSFPAGETTLPISLEVNADSDIEPDEGIIVTLSNPTAGATITTDTATGTVQNDDAAAPEFSIVATDAVLSEGDGGTTNFTFTVTRSANTIGSDTVDYAVTGAAVDGTDGADFVGGSLPSGMLTFADTETTQTITIEVAGDMTAEANEGFIVTLSNPSRSGTLNPAAANGTVLDDDTPPANAWINEFHYDNSGADVGEFIEVAGDAGIDLSGFTIVQYNGSNGLAYGSIPLTGTIDDEGGSGFGALSFTPTDAFQNGNDAFALVDASNRVLDFVSYEGAFDANDGPAAGMTAVDVGVAESSTGPEGVSLQRDNASPANDNTWKGPFAESPGDLNVIPVPVFAISATDADQAEGDGGGNTAFTFTVTRSGDTTGANDVDFQFETALADSADAADFDGGLPSGTLSFAAGETSQVITINVIADADVEPDEGFTISLLSPTGSATIDAGADSADGVIRNDDVAPDPLTVTITLDDISENGGVSSGTVSIPSNATSDVTVTLTSSDPTEALVTSTVTISAGTNSAPFTITAQDDALLDGTQTVTITAQAAGFVDGTDTIDILDDEVLLEFGDAPSAAQSGFAASYPVTLAEDGARHGDSGATLGGGLDLEQDGVHSANADADDTTDTGSSDDEDGVVFAATLIASPLATATGSVDIDLQDPHPTSNLLDAWIDFNQDGDWTDPGEQIFTSFDLGTISGVQTLNFNIPQDAGANVVDGTTFSRFRLSASGGLGVQGAAPDGEVEDHPVTISTLSPALTLTINAASISENGGTSQATVTRNTGTTGALTVDLFSGDTSEATVPSMVTIPDGSDSVTFTINAVDDAILDGTQTVTITAEATGFADGTDTIDVLDDEEPTLTVTTALSEISENGGSSVATVSRNSGTTGDLVVTLSSNDTSEATVPMSVTIPDGSSSVNFTITAVDDALADGTQAVFITALADAFLTGFDSINVTDDESPLLTISIDEISISENGGTSSATVTRNTGTTGDLMVDLSSDDTSEATVPATVTIPDGSDSFTFTITAVDDAFADGTQVVTITAEASGLADGTDTIDVTDDESPLLTISIDEVSISENGGTSSATVTRNTGTTGDLTVDLSSDDTSEATVPATVTIPDGSDSFTFTITAVDDAIADGTQTVSITALAGGFLTGFDSIDITDDESPLLTINIDEVSISENGGTSSATVTRNTGTVGDLVVDLVSDDTSEATVPAQVTIPDGSDSFTFTISAVDDAILDGTQTVTITAQANGLDDGTDTIDVLDDEVPLLTVSIDEVSISEDGGTSSATVTRNTGTVGDLVVDLASNDTSEATVPAQVTIPDGSDSITFTVTAVDDAILDGTQTVTITAEASGLDDGTDTIDVLDDEVPLLTVSIDEVSISEDGGTSSATVTRNTGTVGDLVVDLVSDDTSEATVPAQVTIPDGSDFVTFTISAVDDAILDGTQTVTITAEASGLDDGTDTIDVLDDEVPLLTVSIDEVSISEDGGTSSATVTRNTGTVGDLVVDLVSDDTSEATVPAQVTIPDGFDSITFTVSAADDAILDGTQTATITAQASGFDDGTDTIDVTDDEIVATELLINEILMDPPEALDTGLEYIELRGTADGFLPADSYLVLLEGDSISDPGNVDHIFTLGGLQFDANGFLLLEQNGANGWDQPFSSRSTDIENGSVSFLVITSAAAPIPDTDVDSNDDGTLDGAAFSWTIEDSIGNIQGRADDTGYGAINVSGSGMGLTPAGSTLVDITAQPLLTSFFHPDYVGRNGDSTGSAQDDWVFAEIDGSAPNHVLAVGATVPSNLGGAPLDHLAATNAFDAPETLTVDIAPTSLDEGDTTTVTVSRTGEDISGALTVNLAVDSGRATVPVSVIIAADDASATFTLEAVQNTDVDGDVIVTVTASAAGGFTDGTDSVEIINDDVAPANVWINEFHYDDEGADDNEFVEVAGTAGIDLAGFSIVLYNGNGGGEYFTEALSGTIDDEGSSGFGALAFPIGNIQNGAPDGIALVDAGGAVLQFVSYEGTLTATNGPANGLTSVDVGVRESNGDPAGLSLQRNNAIPANDNPWVGPLDDSPGDLNVIPPPAFTITATNADRLEGSDGGTTTFVFTVTRTGDTSGANDVDFAVTGAATDGADAADFGGGLASGTLMFTAGETSTVILLDVNADTDIEPDEDFIVTLSNATGGASIDTATAAGTIQNDDAAAPDFAIVALDAVQTEGDSGSTDFTFTVTRSANTSGGDTVDFTVTGAAVDGADGDDFAGGVLPSDTVTFADGEISQTITISVAGDTDVEPSEDFIVTLSNASRSGTLSVISANGTVLDDDTPPANAWINEFHYDDAGSDNGEFVEVAGSAGIDLSGFSIVLYNGSNGASYNTVGLTGAIDDEGSGFGAVSFAISGIQNGAPDGIALVDDTGRVLQFVSYEGSLEATNGPAIGLTSEDVGVAETSATPEGVSLQRNNAPAPAPDNPWGGPFPESPGDLNVFPAAVFEITADDAVLPEGDAGLTDFTFTVTRSVNTGGLGSVDFAVTGAAVDGADADDFGGALPTGTVNFAAGEMTQTITVQVSGDTDVEADEGFIVTLSNPTDGATIATATAEGTIQNDDDRALTLSIDALSIDENGTATATISRTGDTSSALLVEIVSDDASEVSHPVMVTIPANEESTTFVVSGVDDGVVDGTQSALLTATAPGHSPDTAGLDVTDVQSATVSIEGTVNGSELDPTNGEFTVSISTAPEADVVVPYTIGGSAVEGVDFAPLSGSVTIIGGTTEATIDVVVLDDLIAELGTDRLELTLEEPVGPLAITVDPLAGSDGIFISDDDLASISVSTNSLTVDETGAFSTATFEVVLTSEPTGNVLINIASSDSAEAAASPLEILFDETNWNTPRTVTVSGRDDGIADGTQLANISLTIDHLTTASRAAEYQLADPTATVVVDVNDTNAVPTAEVERVTFFNEDANVERNFSLDRTGQRSIIRRAEVVVSDVVTVTDASAFTATRTDDGSSVGVSLISATPVNGKTIIVLEFNGGNVDAGGLIDGNYQLQIDGGALGAGGVETHAFHRLFGDSDGDRDVDGADFSAYIGGLFFGSPTANSLFDLNDDDNLFGELASFFSNFGRVLQ